MKHHDSRLTRWWLGSWLYSLLAGSFFLHWLVGADADRETDYGSASYAVAVTERILAFILRGLYRLGDYFSGWLAGSQLRQRWLWLVGLLVLLAAVIVLRITLSLGIALGVALIGLGMMLTPNLNALMIGTQLGRLTTWWLKE